MCIAASTKKYVDVMRPGNLQRRRRSIVHREDYFYEISSGVIDPEVTKLAKIEVVAMLQDIARMSFRAQTRF